MPVKKSKRKQASTKGRILKHSKIPKRVKLSKLQKWKALEEEAGLPQGTIYDDKGADCVQHQIDNPEVYGK